MFGAAARVWALPVKGIIEFLAGTARSALIVVVTILLHAAVIVRCARAIVRTGAIKSIIQLEACCTYLAHHARVTVVALAAIVVRGTLGLQTRLGTLAAQTVVVVTAVCAHVALQCGVAVLAARTPSMRLALRLRAGANAVHAQFSLAVHARLACKRHAVAKRAQWTVGVR